MVAIAEIRARNFKTLRDVRIPLAPGITVMVGANNSGKSNALAALRLAAEAARQEMGAAVQAMGGLEALQTRGVSEHFNICSIFPNGVMYECRPGSARFLHAQQPAQGPWRPAMPEESAKAGAFLSATTFHDLSVAALRSASLVQRDATLELDGTGIAAVLDNLAGEHPAVRDAIDESVRRAAQEVKRVVTRPGPAPGTKVLGVEERDGRVYGAEEMSDGLLLFIGLAVAAQLRVGSPGLLAIEEPERGIHPRRIREVLDMLLRLTESGTQVVLTTHSPNLLDEFRDTPESVLIFDRDEQGTHVTRLSDKPEWVEELQKGAPLGDIWYSGILGGVPGR